MFTIAVSDFRARLNHFLKKVGEGQEIILTSRGQEVAHLTPPLKAKKKFKAQLLKLRSRCHVGDIVSPIETEWDALK